MLKSEYWASDALSGLPVSRRLRDHAIRLSEPSARQGWLRVWQWVIERLGRAANSDVRSCRRDDAGPKSLSPAHALKLGVIPASTDLLLPFPVLPYPCRWRSQLAGCGWRSWYSLTALS